MSPTRSRVQVATEPTRDQWRDLVAPPEGQGETVELGRRQHESGFVSVEQVRQRVAQLSFLPIDPYVATVGCAVHGERVEIPKGEESVTVDAPDFYAEPVEVFLGTHHGPGAPLLVILPGIHSSGQSAHNNVFRKMALERGMNYVVLPNSLSQAMLEDKPHYHPGNPRLDAEASHQILRQLRSEYPEYFEHLSVAGYSYGALHGANLVRFDEEQDERLIRGSLVALSPPENLAHSMRELDGLRELYREGAGSIPQTGLKYRSEVKKHGYHGFMESDLAARGPGSNATEIKIADKYGSRDGLQTLIETIDTQFGHHRLPRNTPEYKEASWWQRHKMRQDHDRQVEEMTYGRLSQEWMSQDPWLIERGMTPEQLAERYSFSEAIQAIDETPVLALGSSDDYILSRQNAATLRSLETQVGELEVVRMLDTGGHVGLTWNPEIEATLADFAWSPFASPAASWVSP